MEKECEIVMVSSSNGNPTNILYLEVDTDKIIYHDFGMYRYAGTSQLQPHHLYLTSDDTIEDDDWYLVRGSNRIELNSGPSKIERTINKYKKIIASTDKNLNRYKVYRISKKGETLHQDIRGTYEWKIRDNKIAMFKDLFVKEYCENGGIDKVLVEYEKVFSKTKCSNCNNTGYLESEDFMQPRCTYCNRDGKQVKEILQPKVDSDNSIVLKLIKDSWTKEEVEALCRRALHKRHSGYNNICMQEDADKWIKENL